MLILTRRVGESLATTWQLPYLVWRETK